MDRVYRDLTVYVDDVAPVLWRYKDSNGVAASLTGTSFDFIARWPNDAGGLLLKTGVNPEIQVLDQGNPQLVGLVQLILTPAQRAALPPQGQARYVLLRRWPDGQTITTDVLGRLSAVNWLERGNV